MRPRPVWLDQAGRFWKRRRLVTEQAKLKLCKAHSAISILIQFAEQFFKFLDKSHHSSGLESHLSLSLSLQAPNWLIQKLNCLAALRRLLNWFESYVALSGVGSI